MRIRIPFQFPLAALAVLCGVTAAADGPVVAQKPHIDRFGDPLPRGVLVRIGSRRLMHSGPVDRVAFSRDGNRIISAGEDLSVRVWDASTGRPLARLSFRKPDLLTFMKRFRTTKQGITDGLNRFQQIGRVAAFSPDAKEVAIYDRNGVTVWNVFSGRKRFQLCEFSDVRPSVLFSPDGKSILTDTGAKSVPIQDARNGRLSGELKTPGRSFSSSRGRRIIFSRDGTKVAIGHQLFDYRHRKPLGPIRGLFSVTVHGLDWGFVEIDLGLGA